MRQAALDSYGVAAVIGRRWYDRALGRLGVGTPGVRVRGRNGLRVEINVALAEGVPPAAVLANVGSAVRYVVQRDLGRTIDDLDVLVRGRPLAAAKHGTPRRRGPDKG